MLLVFAESWFITPHFFPTGWFFWLVIWKILEHGQNLKYRTGHLVKLYKCQSSSIRQSFMMNFWTIFSLHGTGHVFGFQGFNSDSRSFFVKKLSSPKLFILEWFKVWDHVIEILAMSFPYKKKKNPYFQSQDAILLTLSKICDLTSSALSHYQVWPVQNIAVFRDDQFSTKQSSGMTS